MKKPVEIRPWRVCPFIPGARYRVMESVILLEDNFEAGEEMTFVRDAYSRYDGMTGYFFRDERGEARTFVVLDAVEGDAWHLVFERMP